MRRKIIAGAAQTMSGVFARANSAQIPQMLQKRFHLKYLNKPSSQETIADKVSLRDQELA